MTCRESNLHGTVVAPNARVTFLINSMEGGGAERAMANLLHHLLPHMPGHPIELVLLDDLATKQTLPDELPVHTLDGRGGLVRSLRALSRHWRLPQHRPDVCISFLSRANVANVWLSRRFGHRAIISERVNTSSHLAASRAAPILKAITRWTYPRAAKTVAVSEGVADDLVVHFGVPRKRITVIGNAIDRSQLKALAGEQAGVELPSDFLLGLGRLVPNKNFSLVLDAYAKATSAPPLVILGQGPEEAALRAQADQRGIADRVIFTGFLNNPYPVMARARALISGSRAEGFPNTLIEAMTLGCPVIATDCPSGPAEVLAATPVADPPWPTTAHGILIAMEDQNAMTAAILSICDNQTRQDYAERAEKRALNYGVSTVVDAYLGLVNDYETT